MGGKGSGRKPIYSDKYHKMWRKNQLKYDRKIRTIMKKRKCGYKEAQEILRVKKAKEILSKQRRKKK